MGLMLYLDDAMKALVQHDFIDKEWLKDDGLELIRSELEQKCYLREPVDIVRCKDCKHRPIMPDDHTDGFDLKFPDGKCPCQCDDGWYSWYPSDDWFCADGERAENAR